MAQLLDKTDLEATLAGMWGWTDIRNGKAMTKTFEFADFNMAFGWMSRVAMKAEKMDHHPEWRNVFRTVEVVLTTHSAGGVTDLDVKMAEFMDAIS